MGKTSIIISVLSILVIAGIIFEYSHESHSTTEIVVLRDITDPAIAVPNVDEILSLYNFSDENKWSGGIFRYSILSDVSYNKVSEAKLGSADKWLSNEIERDKEVKQFKGKVSEILSAKDSIGKNNSSVYLPIARELKLLSESKSQKRILIVFSDLMENDPDISLYNKKEFYLLHSNPDSLKKIFAKWVPLPSLNDIKVFLIYQPTNVDADKEFKEVSGFYKNLLEEKGATVHVVANLIN